MSLRMAIRFFRKMGTSSVPIPGRRSIAFDTLDQLRGYFATDNPMLCSEFERCMTEGRSGITEIDEATFHREFVEPKKNGVSSKPFWREEIGPNLRMPSGSQLADRLRAAQPVVGVVSPPPPSSAPSPAALSHAAAVNREIVKELPKAEDYKPIVGKRKRAKP